VDKAKNEGPAAWVIPGDDPRPAECAEVVNLLRLQGVEVERLASDTEVAVGQDGAKRKFAAGSYVVRMDQPYSRMADMLLDTQYYNVGDPPPYDDTGWTVGPLHNITTVRIAKPDILQASMTLVGDGAKVAGKMTGPASAAAYLINHNADNTLATFRFKLKDVKMFAAEDAFKSEDRGFAAGSFIVKMEGNPSDLRTRLETAAAALGIAVYASGEVPKVAMHELAAPRIALVHTWTNTQNEGWFRVAFDRLQIPYDYISDQKLRETANLRDKWDVILFGPVAGTAQRIVNGTPMRGDPVPWKKTDLTPNLGGSPDTTDDMRGGMGLEGLVNVTRFIDAGGLFITITGNASIPIEYGIIEGVTIGSTPQLRASGSVINAAVADRRSPIAYGYGDKLAVYFNQSPVFSVSAGGGFGGGGGRGAGGGGGRGAAAAAGGEGAAAFGGGGTTGPNRPTGRGTLAEPDIPQGRPLQMASPPAPRAAGQPAEEADFGGGGGGRGAPLPPELRPRVVLRFAEEKDLLVSGMLAGGSELANQAAVVDVPRGKGHVLLFANNPMWRNETQGSYFLLFNAMLNFDHLGVGVAAAPAAGRGGRGGGQ
jgi:hypothetical protein